MPVPADMPPPLSAMSAIVERAVENERLFVDLARRLDEITRKIASTPNPQIRLLTQWQSLYERTSKTIHDQTDACRRGFDVFKEMTDAFKGMVAMNERVQLEYRDLYANFAARLKEAGTTPSDEMMRQTVLAYQLAERRVKELEARTKILEEGLTPEAQYEIDRLKKAVLEENASKLKLFWSMAGMVSAPTAVAVLFYLLGLH